RHHQALRQRRVPTREIASQGDGELTGMAPGQLFQDGEQSFLESGPVGALPGRHHVPDQGGYLHHQRKYTVSCAICASTRLLAPGRQPTSSSSVATANSPSANSRCWALAASARSPAASRRTSRRAGTSVTTTLLAGVRIDTL